MRTRRASVVVIALLVIWGLVTSGLSVFQAFEIQRRMTENAALAHERDAYSKSIDDMLADRELSRSLDAQIRAMHNR